MNNIPSLFEIRLLGTPRLLLNGHIVDGLRRKNRALIYYVAAPGGAHEVEVPRFLRTRPR